MKYFSVCMLLACSAVSLEYTPFKLKPDPTVTYGDVMDVVKRGSVKAFADMNVEKAMTINKSSGKFPVPDAKVEEVEEPKIAQGTQNWEFFVKKGNSDFSDTQVEKALDLIPEPIIINGKVMPAGEEKMDVYG